MRLYHEAVIISSTPPTFSDHHFCANSDRKSIRKIKLYKSWELFRLAKLLSLTYARRRQVHRYERLFGSRRSHISQNDDGYVGEAASGFDQTMVSCDGILALAGLSAIYRRKCSNCSEDRTRWSNPSCCQKRPDDLISRLI